MPQPKKVEFNCTVITPMFLAGADQNKPELRVPSLRGELRWWLRALLGATTIQNADDLFSKESEVFGSVDKVSEVTIKLSIVQEASDRASNLFQQHNQMQGMRYLWYSTNLGQNNRPYFKPEDTQFKVSFISKNDDALKKAICAFWALSVCGGLGTRSRRGAGSFSARITYSDIEKNHLPEFEIDFVPENFTKQFEKIERTFGSFPVKNARKAWPSFSKVNIFRANLHAQKWQDAVEQVGKALQEFRNRRQPDYQNVKDFIQHGTIPQTVERAAFGLPLMFRYRSLPNPNNSAIISLNLDDSDRRASPLWISIIKLPNSQYDAVLTYFDSLFLPNDARLEIKAKQQNPQVVPQTPNTNIIQAFINGKFPNKQAL
ncbi:MAG: type III-B CRISPR module RAMP protein Cmr1 [Chloroherpetonaceae bacterium]|nr:type III-B CRISPR module RAMP protein Cmr1 [Chloroherpetonaceae bacterium]